MAERLTNQRESLPNQTGAEKDTQKWEYNFRYVQYDEEFRDEDGKKSPQLIGFMDGKPVPVEKVLAGLGERGLGDGCSC